MLTLSTRATRVVLALLLAVLICAVFSAALPGAFIWDDRTLIEDNSQITNLGNIVEVFTRHFLDSDQGSLKVANLYYRPLVTVSFMVDHALYGLAPWGYHLTNILLHFLATLLVYSLAIRVLRPAGLRASPATGGVAELQAEVVPWMVAALFAVHPSRVEAVTWISGRTDVMMAILALASMLLFWRALEDPQREPRARRLLLAGAWATFVCALLCKETVVALAVVVPVMDWALISRGDGKRLWSNARWCHSPLVVSTAAFIGFRLWYQGQMLGPRAYADMGLGERALILLETVGHYLPLTFAPYSPNMQVGAYYTPQTPDWMLVATGGVIIAGYGVALWWTVRRGRRAAAFALVLGGAFFAPTSNVIPLSVHALAADRFLYVPLLGAALLAGMGLMRVLTRPRVRSLVLLLAGLVALSWAVLANLRSRDFSDPVRFWASELAASPDNPLVLDKLGTIIMERHKYRQAEFWFHRSLEALLRRGRPPDKVIERMLKVYDSHLLHTSDHDTVALTDMLRLLARLNQIAAGEARQAEKLRVKLHQQIVALDLSDPGLHGALKMERARLLSIKGNIHSRLGQDRQALDALRIAAATPPESLAITLNLVLASIRALSFPDAARALAMAQKVRPDAPEIKSMARLLDAVKVRAKQLRALGYQGLGTPSNDPRVHWILAEIQKATGARHRSCRHLSRIIQISPDSRKAWALLVTELASGGDPRGALKVLAAAKKRFGAEPGLLRLEQQLKTTTSPIDPHGKKTK